MAIYLRATGRECMVPLIEQHQDLLVPDAEVEANPEAYYDRVIRLDLSALEPHIVGPHSPDRARPISKFASEIADGGNGFVDKISTTLIGSCTNSSYEDMSRAADIAAQATAQGIKAAVPLLVTPGSEQVRATIERDGQLQSLKDINATVLANACGPCIGQWRRASEAAGVTNTIVTSYNRNFPRRNDGQPTTMNFIASPEIVTAFALAGRLSFNPVKDTLMPIAKGFSAWSRGPPGTAAIFSTCRSCSRARARQRPITFRRPVHGFVTGVTSIDSATTCSWVRPMPSRARRAMAKTCCRVKPISPLQKLPATTNRAAPAGWWSAISITAKAAAGSMPRSHRGFSAAWR
jgi:hypothetical protein